MGGKVGFIISIVATIMFYLGESMIFFWISIVVTIVLFWSWGVMHNYVMSLAKRRFEQLKKNKIEEGASHDEIKRVKQIKIQPSLREMQSVPNSISIVNMIATFGAVILFITSLIIYFL